MREAELSSQSKGIQLPADLNRYCIYIPAIIKPADLLIILGVKCPKMLAKLPIPRCRINGGSKYVYLAHDVLDYLRSQRDITEVDLDD